MPEWLMPVLFAAILSGLTAMCFKGAKHLPRGDGETADSPVAWPRVAAIVPVSGNDVRMAECLMSLLAQDYPSHYEIIFATRDEADPATTIVRGLVDRHAFARQVLAGDAGGCGQKNRNLLAGLKEVSPASEVLVFCDGTRLAPRQWLKEQVRPIASGETVVASGFHYGVVEDSSLSGLGQAITIMLISLLRCFERFNQPWGGSTAILRRTFDSLDVERTWSSNVVDDVSLALLLRKAGIPVVLATKSYFCTPISGQTAAGWRDWLTRQWLYLKFIFPWSWLAAGLCCHVAAGAMLVAGWQCIGSLLPGPASRYGALAALFLLLVELVGVSVRRLHPRPGSLLRWIVMFPAVVLMAGWCHLRGTFARTIRWRGIDYRVTMGGRVVAKRVRFH